MVAAVFLFRHDLRIQDNTAFIKALREESRVLPVFIFPPEQIEAGKNKYYSNPAVQFMCESLVDLHTNLKKHKGALHCFRDTNVGALEKIWKQYPFDVLYTNEDYSVYAKKRDAEVKAWCDKKGIDMITCEDYPLIPLKDGRLPNGKPYVILSQYYQHLLKYGPAVHPVQSLPSIDGKIVATKLDHEIDFEVIQTFYKPNPTLLQKGGRNYGLKVLARLANHKEYATTRDFPAIEGTTRASAHLRFGTISVREFYWRAHKLFGADNPIIRELVFRDFYLKIYTHWPELQRGTAYRKGLDAKIPWSYDRTRWKAWTEGRMGYPLADAGMRQLIGEGWVHNRVRMLVASVATRYLLLDWRKCAQYFYQNLVDADPFSNTAGWQWSAGIGVDSAPYFRAPFNPFRQSERFDHQAEYIKRWVPELKEVDSKDIHKWFDPTIRAKYPNVNYPAPLIDPKDAVKLYRSWKI